MFQRQASVQFQFKSDASFMRTNERFIIIQAGLEGGTSQMILTHRDRAETFGQRVMCATLNPETEKTHLWKVLGAHLKRHTGCPRCCVTHHASFEHRLAI